MAAAREVGAKDATHATRNQFARAVAVRNSRDHQPRVKIVSPHTCDEAWLRQLIPGGIPRRVEVESHLIGGPESKSFI
jgi:hypothetical protein